MVAQVVTPTAITTAISALQKRVEASLLTIIPTGLVVSVVVVTGATAGMIVNRLIDRAATADPLRRTIRWRKPSLPAPRMIYHLANDPTPWMPKNPCKRKSKMKGVQGGRRFKLLLVL
jgi:hypothetical protein